MQLGVAQPYFRSVCLCVCVLVDPCVFFNVCAETTSCSKIHLTSLLVCVRACVCGWVGVLRGLALDLSAGEVWL